MIKGDRLELTIDAIDDEGAGVGNCQEWRVHVGFSLPGERVAATVEHCSPHATAAWAHLDTLLEPSPARVAPACAAFSHCGGCLLQHWHYPEQLAHKRSLVERSLGPLGIRVAETVPSLRPFGYRNRSKFVVGQRDGRILLGAYAPRSHRLIDLTGCAIAEPPIEATAQAIGQIATELGVLAYDETSGTGDLRYVVLRSNHAGKVLALFVVPRRNSRAVRDLARRLRAARPEVVGVVENLQPEQTNVLYGQLEPDRPLDGGDTIEDRMGPVKLRLSPRAFLQINRSVAARIYADLAAAVGRAERAIDVYCGVGAIALTLSAEVIDVLGIEEVAEAIEDARASAELNSAKNVRFVAGDAALVLADPTIAGKRADAVVLNPPRRGCLPEVLAAAARLEPRTLVYVSCNPTTLARDLKLLDQLGYRAESATPYDMLPHTPHVEIMTVLQPR